MKSINLLPKSIQNQIELKKFFFGYTVAGAVIFLLLMLLVAGLDMSARMLRAQIQPYNDMQNDEKYIDSERIASELRAIQGEASGFAVAGELIMSEYIELNMVAMTAGIMMSTQGSDKFLLLEDLTFDNEGKISLSGITSERSLIDGLIGELRSKNAFVYIDVPTVMSEPNGIFKFKMILTTVVSE